MIQVGHNDLAVDKKGDNASGRNIFLWITRIENSSSMI